MTRIHFYQISGGLEATPLLLSQLITNALARRRDILIHVSDQNQAALIEPRLAQLCPAPLALTVDACRPVTLTCNQDPGHHHGLLINLAADIPPWFSRFERMAELVYDQPGLVADKRASYRFYRDRGYPLHFHALTQVQDLLTID